MNTSRQILAFSHIPKSAGTTFNVMLRRYFGASLMAARYRNSSKGATYRLVDLERDCRLFPRLQCISGHCVKPFVDFGRFEKELQWFTFMRNPVERFFSHYVHQQTGTHQDYIMPLDEWVNRFKRRDWCVRMIAGEYDLEAAKQILDEKFKFVGLVEEFEQSIRIFANQFQLEGFDTSLPESKMVTRDPKLKAQMLEQRHQHQEILESNTALDQQLYRHVTDHIWPNQIAQHENDSNPAPVVNKRHFFNLAKFVLKDKLIYWPYVRWYAK